MLGLTFTVDSNAAPARSGGALDGALHEARADDARIRIAAPGPDSHGHIRCTVHFSELGLLDGFVGRLTAARVAVAEARHELEPAGASPDHDDAVRRGGHVTPSRAAS